MRQKRSTSASSGNNAEPYDPLRFIIRARNDNDHSDYLPKTQVTPELKAEAYAIGESSAWEFGSVAAFVRWCVVLGVEECRKINPRWPTNISIIRAMELESARLQTRINFLEHIEKKAKEAFELTGRGMHAEAARHVYAVLAEVRKMDKADPWRAYYETEIKKRFGKLLTKGRIVSHVPEKPPPEPKPHPDWNLEEPSN